MSGLQIISIKREPNLDENCGMNGDEDPGSRCGEIYVGNNAKKWTFICTFCDKSMRKIDEFINHIKHSHVHFPPPLPSETSETNCNFNPLPIRHLSSSMRCDVPQFNPLDRTLTEFVDYNDFLDVNVQTVPEVILSDSSERLDPPVEERTMNKTRIKSEPNSDKDSEKEDADYDKHNESIHSNETTLSSLSQSIVPSANKVKSQRKSKSRRKQIKGPAYCPICKRTFQYHSLYRNHMVKHTTETPFKCTLCKKGFKSKQALRYHMTTHLRETTFKCKLCDVGFRLECQFVAHMISHKGENIHPCEVCGKISRTKFEKDVHMGIHTDERPFACEFCQKRFRLRHHLSNHLKLHFTYRCAICRNQFSNNAPLKKPYTCSDCQTVATNLSDNNPVTETNDENEEEDSDDETKDATFHPKASTRNPEAMKPHTCKICNNTYANKRGLSVHMSTKH